MTIRTLIAAAGMIAATTIAQGANTSETYTVEVSAFEPESKSETSTTSSWTRTVVHDDGTEYEIREENGEMRFFINGEEVGRDDFEETGKVLRFPNDGFRAVVRAPLPPRTQGQVAVLERVRPKVMLGINLDAAPESLLEHLGVESDAIIVERVVEGLTADKAGIKEGDVIVSIDGNEGITPGLLTEILSGFEPGQNVTIKVIRKGKVSTLNAEMMAYDSEALGNITVIGRPLPPGIPEPPRGITNDFFSMGDKGRELRTIAEERIEVILEDAGIGDRQIRVVTEQIGEVLQEMEEELRGAVSTGLLPQVQSRSGSSEQAIAEMQAKAEQALRNAERQMLEYRDGRLLLRERAQEELNRHLNHVQEQLNRQSIGMSEQLQERLEQFERRMSAMDERFERMADMFEEFAEQVIDRLEEDDD